MTTTHIIIPDSHASPESNPRRFIALGNFLYEYANKHRNDTIVTIELGDLEDMPSLSSFDVGKLAFEGRRFADDIIAANIARDYIYNPINNFVQKLQSQKKKFPKVTHIALGGNHYEGRIKRYEQRHPELANLLWSNGVQLDKWQIQYSPFLVPKRVDGISYSHYFQQRGTGKPIGTGKYPAAAILRELHVSSVVGHSHVLDRATQTNAAGSKIFSLVAGCYLDPDEFEEYAGQGNDQWWKGITILRGVENGFPHSGEEYISARFLINQYL